MTVDEFTQAMRKIYVDWEWDEFQPDAEGSHLAADRVMCKFLREAGCSEGVELFENAERWYA